MCGECINFWRVSLPVLTIQHEDDCPPARVPTWAQAHAVDLDIRRPYAGDPLPDSITGFAGLVVLGGGMAAYDDAHFPWLPATRRLIAETVVREVPFLGFCLGHQLAAIALGGTVSLRPQGPGRGVAPVNPTAALADDPLFSLLPGDTVSVEWNRDIVSELPAGAVTLSRDSAGHPQLVRFGPRAWGLQCHPEVTADVFDTWVVDHPLPAAVADAERVAAITAEVHASLPRIERDWAPPMEAFFALTAGREPDPVER